MPCRENDNNIMVEQDRNSTVLLVLAILSPDDVVFEKMNPSRVSAQFALAKLGAVLRQKSFSSWQAPNDPRTPRKVLEGHKREKKKKYLEACLEQHRHFSPFVVSTDGLLGKESRTLLKKLSALLTEKWEKPYSEICGYVNAQMSIAMVRATHVCLRGSRIPTSQMSNGRPQ
jgi:hypothetical protein